MPQDKRHPKKLREMICTAFDFPASAARTPILEIIGRHKIVALECGTIDKYSESEILLSMSNHKSQIVGKCLSIYAFVDGKLEITGEISAINFYEAGGVCP